MIRLIRFNLFSFASRLTTYVIPLITLVVVVLTAIIFSILPGENFINKSLTLPILFFFSMVFLIQSTIIFFKLPQEESVLPIMMTKPYSKRKLYFSHLISNELVIVLFSIFISSLFTIIGAIDGGVSGKDLSAFFGSALIGNIIIMTIFASLISLTCLVLSSSWNTLLWMMIVFIIPISSSMASLSLNKKFDKAEAHKYNVVYQNDKGQMEMPEMIYLDVRDSSGNILDDQTKSWNESRNNPYATFAWFDPWYQLSDLYSMFREKDTDWSMSKWEESSTTLNNAFSITLDYAGTTNTYSVIVKPSQYEVLVPKNLEYAKSSPSYRQLVEDKRNEISSLPFERQLYFFVKNLNNGSTQAMEANFNDDLDKVVNGGINMIQQETILSSIDDYSLEAYMYFKNEGIINAASTNVDWANINPTRYGNLTLIDNDSILKTFTPSKFIDTKWIIIIWSTILLITVGGGILIYTRKEINQA